MLDKLKIGARLRAARKAAGFKTSLAFCEKFTIPSSTYSQNESGVKAPRTEALKKYAECLGVNFEWLKSGIGEPILEENTHKTMCIKEDLSETNMADELIGQRYALSPIDESLLADVLRVLLQHFQVKEKNDIDPEVIAKAVSGLYNNLRKMDKDPHIRTQLIKVAVETYFKFCI